MKIISGASLYHWFNCGFVAVNGILLQPQHVPRSISWHVMNTVCMCVFLCVHIASNESLPVHGLCVAHLLVPACLLKLRIFWIIRKQAFYKNTNQSVDKDTALNVFFFFFSPNDAQDKSKEDQDEGSGDKYKGLPFSCTDFKAKLFDHSQTQ